MTDTSPLHGTTYGQILKGMKEEGGPHNFADAVLMVSDNLDTMMHTRKCTNVHKYLNDDRFDTVGLEAKLVETFGAETVEWTKK